MFFRNKKPKITGRERFQHRQFTQKLHQARNFKRQARYIPEHPVDLFLSRFGLGSRWAQILTGLILLGIVYLAYIPNFLSVKDVTILGLSDANQVIAEGAVRQAIHDAPLYNPQYNLILMSEERIKQALSKLPSVYQTQSIKKDFKTNTVIVEVQAKYERFLVTDEQQVYDVYNDGVLKAQAGVSKDDWAGVTNPNMLKVKLPGPVHPGENQPFFIPGLVAEIETIANGLKAIPASPLAYFQLGTPKFKQVLQDDGSTVSIPEDLEVPVKSDEIRAVLQKGQDRNRTFTVIFDSQSDLNETLKKLELLLSQTPPDRYNNLFYIDMRLSTRGYVCLINTPCAK